MCHKARPGLKSSITMRETDKVSENEYFKLLLLKVILQATKSWGNCFHKTAQNSVKTLIHMNLIPHQRAPNIVILTPAMVKVAEPPLTVHFRAENQVIDI